MLGALRDLTLPSLVIEGDNIFRVGQDQMFVNFQEHIDLNQAGLKSSQLMLLIFIGLVIFSIHTFMFIVSNTKYHI